MLIVAGTIDVDPAQRAQFLEGREQAILAARAEAGCIEYAMGADCVDPGRVRIFEKWEDKAALAAHLDGMRRTPPPSSGGVTVLARDLMQYVIGEAGPLGT
jgi:quinol monooxygenase YgiN